MNRLSCVLCLSLAALTSGCGSSEAPSTEVTPDLVEQAKVHDQKVADEEKAHQAAEKAEAAKK